MMDLTSQAQGREWGHRMKVHKRVLTWLLIKLFHIVGPARIGRRSSEHTRIFALIAKLSSYVNDQPTRYDVSKEQFNRAVDLRNLAVRHFNALVAEETPLDRLQRVQAIYMLADEELNIATEADLLNMEMELSDIEEQREP